MATTSTPSARAASQRAGGAHVNALWGLLRKETYHILRDRRTLAVLIFSFTIYNIVAFLMHGFSWSMEVVQFRLASGGMIAITAGDLIVGGSILILLIESRKRAARGKEKRQAAEDEVARNVPNAKADSPCC